MIGSLIALVGGLLAASERILADSYPDFPLCEFGCLRGQRRFALVELC